VHLPQPLLLLAMRLCLKMLQVWLLQQLACLRLGQGTATNGVVIKAARSHGLSQGSG
jgi:hypothetical protein